MATTANRSPLYPHIRVTLSDCDGNVYLIIGTVARALRAGGVSEPEVTAFVESVFHAESYADVLRRIWHTVEVD